MTGTEPSSSCQVSNAEIFARVCHDPTLGFLQCRPADRNSLTFTAELHLSARPFKEHNELGRHLHGNLSTKILLNDRKGKISPGGHSGRRSQPSVADMDSVRV